MTSFGGKRTSLRSAGLSPGFASRMNLFADLAIVFIATLAAANPATLAPADTNHLFWSATAAVTTWVMTAAALRHYHALAYDRSALDDVAMTTILAAAVITVLSLIDLVAPAGTAVPRIPHVLAMIWVPTVILRRFFALLADSEPPTDEILIVGIGPIGRLTAWDIRRQGHHRVIGHLRLPDENGRETALLQRSYQTDGAECRILGDADTLEEVLRKVPVDEIYIAGKMRTHGEEMQASIRVCERLGIPFALPAYGFRLERAQAVHAEAVADGYLHYQTYEPKPQQQAMKRLFDIVASALALWVLLPLFLVVMVLIKLTSRGPIFFRQVRVGLHGRTFNMLKFRSMAANAEALKSTLAAANEQSGPVFKMRFDPRVTRVGRFIRRYSIDELPQLINVLRGDMSVVGPRPPVPDEVAKYEAWQRRRLSVRPGLTCIWQVSGRNQISFEDWMVLDMQYIDHWSLAQDFSLIFRTIPVVITGRGAS
jgi:exopolysaccharide biosynthesis polyprenyl glycosylphosphotransferase